MINIEGGSKMVKSIYLQDGEEIFVDDEVWEAIKDIMWSKQYTQNTRNILGFANGRIYSLINIIAGEGVTQKVKNNDFTFANLIRASNHSWVRWSKAQFNSTNKYKGVHFDESRNKYIAQIRTDGKNTYLGRFKTEEEAATAYNNAVDKYWNGFGFKNVIGEDNRGMARDYKTYSGRTNQRVGKFGYRGVKKRRYKDRHYYTSRIRYKGKDYHINQSDSLEKVALAYNKVALFLFQDNYAPNNVPLTDELKEFIDNWEIPKKIKELKK